MKDFFSFPEVVNEISARLVAFGVLSMALLSLVLINTNNTYTPILLLILLYGFLARTSSGPKISPLALLVTRIIVPKLNLGDKPVPGPPKRFAQSIGLVFSLLILVSWFSVNIALANTLLIILASFAFLESALGYCFGCKVFKLLIRAGLLPEDICEKCSTLEY